MVHHAPNPLKPNRRSRLRNWLRTFPRWTVWTVVVGAVVLGTATAWLGAWKLQKRWRQAAISEQWDRFEKAARTSGDEDEMREALAGVLAVDPANDRAQRMRRALETGEADASDQSTCLLTMIQHLRKHAVPEAAREARKRLTAEPNDWLARCVVAEAALAAGDRAGADAELDRLPDPAKVPPNISALVPAHTLFLHTGRDTAPFRKYVANSLVDVLGSVSLEKFSPATKVQILECYLLGFQTAAGQRLEDRLSLGVTPALKLADQAFQAAAEANDEPRLVQLGVVCNRLLDAFALLHRDKQITAEQLAGLTHEHEQRIGKVWKAVLERNPKAAAAYQGLALWHSRGGRPAEARDAVVTGLRECGDNGPLLALYSQMLIRDDKAGEAAARLYAAAEREPDNVMLWLLAAETAAAANRRDVALAACRKARGVAPNHPHALRTEAALHLTAGRWHDAIQLLQPLGDQFLLTDPRLARAYLKALVEAGLGANAPEFVAAAETAALKAGSPQLAAEVLSGLSECRYDPALAKLGEETIERLAARWPADPSLLAAKAQLLEHAAENATPRWEPKRVRDALAALERVRAIQSDGLDLAALLAWVRLKGTTDADRAERALRDAAPLVAADDRGTPLTGFQPVILGVVYVANKKFEPAVRVLELARKSGAPTATGLIHLALAYHARGQTDQARAALDDARPRPMSDQDKDDFAAAQATILREKP